MSTILLVEDNELNRDMLSRRLQRKGYTVTVAVDGEEAVAKASADSPANGAGVLQDADEAEECADAAGDDGHGPGTRCSAGGL